MKFIQIGLGSMGKRRIRCLKALGYSDITGFDPRADRREEARRLYGIQTIDSEGQLLKVEADAFILSTPPDLHQRYLRIALARRLPAFVEASVILKGMDTILAESKRLKVLVAPSCTMRFHPAIKDIKRIVQSGRYGRVTNFSYHFGNYLPDWHPWEKVKDFYVSNPATGACREIVPFELTWLTDIIGMPTSVKAFHGRTMDVGAPIDDTYVLSLQFKSCLATLLVDVVARYYIRSLILNMERGQILWRWDIPRVDVYEAEERRWLRLEQPEPKAVTGYNKNIAEQMYIDEIDSFVRAAKGKGKFPNTLAHDISVLRVLAAAEGKAKL